MNLKSKNRLYAYASIFMMEREEFQTTRRLLEAIVNAANKGLSRPVKTKDIAIEL